MATFCATHRFPRARIDPIDDAGARIVIGSMIARPRRPETLMLLLDHEYRGLAIVNVADTTEPDAIHDIADVAAATAAELAEVGGVVLATVRPDAGDDLDDVQRWLDIDEELARAGVELIEWYVYGRTISRPRALVGEPSRWPA